MPDAPELPEAKDPFERAIAISIAIMAVLLSFIDNKGDNAKTDSILKTNEATNKWAYFQSKSIKQSLREFEADMIKLSPSAASGEAAKKLDEMKLEIERYGAEKEKIGGEAKQLVDEATASGEINDKCDQAALLLQIAVVIASVAILTRWKLMWYASLVLAAAGSYFGVLAFL
ncbi:MAG: DUF4337 domain-containing protein [Verrucomicrobiaceae bacterium]|nr:DUF4337 domain-containing protein [Verrucomicrobiaceae bacterium]